MEEKYLFDSNYEIKIQNDSIDNKIKSKKRFREYNPNQQSFLQFDPLKNFPEGSYERFIVDTILKIDIKKFSEKTGDDLGGRDELHPRSMLATIFYSYSDGIFSSRQIEECCIHDTRYIFISGAETPDHSTIARFINKYEEAINNHSDKKENQDFKLLSDSGYYCIENLKYCEENDIDAYIPESKDKNVYIEPEGEKEIKKVTSKECSIEIKNGSKQLVCPGNIQLELYGQIEQYEEAFYKFRINEKDRKTKCTECKYYSKCINNKKTKRFTIKKELFDNYELAISMRNKIKSDSGKMIYSRRMPSVEKIFGHIKGNLNLKSFTLRGLKKVKTQWSILCSVYNLKRMFNLTF